MKPIVLADFQATGWNANASDIMALIQGVLTTQDVVFSRFGITQDLHIVHLMAQLSHESGQGREMTESLNYKPAALLKQWPKHFSPVQAADYGRTPGHPANQKMIGILAYGGRMGNDPAPSEDGYNYRGRGFIQTTGKAGYRGLGQLTGLDLINNPELVNDPSNAFECAVAEFVNYPNMLVHCENDDLLAVSSLINVGKLVSNPNSVVGYSDRAAQLKLWKNQYGI
jgi:putative chitinase